MASNSRKIALLFAALAAGVLSASAAHAFTFEDGKGNSIPKFDLDEQTRQFRKPELDTSDAAKKALETPFGRLQFGVGQGNQSAFGLGGSNFATPFGPGYESNSAAANRKHHERMFSPDYLLNR